MKALLIDPHAQTVTTVITQPDFEALYSMLDAHIVDIVRLGKSVILIDDEGLLKDPDNQRYWRLTGIDQAFAGKALVCGISGEDLTDVPVSVAIVSPAVTWVPELSEEELTRLTTFTITDLGTGERIA